MTREKWIDNAKGIAMLLIILGHVAGGSPYVHWVYGVHLVVFFLLSGFLFRKRHVTREYLNKRFLRLMVPYFYTCAAILITDVLAAWGTPTVETTDVISRDLLRSFFASGAITSFGRIDLGTRIGAIWFLPAMFFAMLFFQIVLNSCGDRHDLAGLYTATIAVFGYVSARFIWFPFSIQAGMMGSFFLWIGYTVRRYELLSKTRWYYYPSALIVLLIAIVWGYCDIPFVSAYAIDIVVSLFAGFSGCLLIYLIAIHYRGNILSYIGKISLTVLCTHLYALETLTKPFYAFVEPLRLSHRVSVCLVLLIEILFAVLVAAAIETLKPHLRHIQGLLFEKEFKKTGSSSGSSNRDVTIDVAKGILIIAMVIGHLIPLNTQLRTIIFSCHMVAFVFLSGYFYNSSRSFLKTIRRMARTFLLPYCIFVICMLVLDLPQWNWAFLRSRLVQYLLGVSYVRKLFPGTPTVGPVYFILLLFVVRILYMLVDRYFKNEVLQWLAVFAVSLSGMYLGNHGYWLPWSIDVACYCLVFYKLGCVFRRKDWLQRVKEDHFCYFVFSPVWVYMIYIGGMEIAVRKYGEYGIVILGALMGTLLVIKLSDYIANRLPVSCQFFRLAGEASIVILIVHTLIGWRIGPYLSQRFDPDYIPYLVVYLLIQVIPGLLIYQALRFLRRKKA